jgi:hypothetical protein
MKGHIRERSPGRWAIVIDVKDSQTCGRKRRWHSFKGTKREAHIECARLISEAQQGGAVDPSRITLAEFLDRFEADWISVHVTALTAERYRHALQHVRQYLGGRPLQKVQAGDLAGLYASESAGAAATDGPWEGTRQRPSARGARWFVPDGRDQSGLGPGCARL